MIKYIDLFAGIGGFHQALDKIKEDGKDTKCVFASEIDRNAIKTYEKNYGISSDNDITKVDPALLEDYELLCAGFPCQAFSKAGSQLGFKDETKGTLFFEIERLLKYRVENADPVKYIILENVANLVTHDKGRTWKVIKKHLKNLGYILTEEPLVLSPHQFGVPQLRNRVFILGVHEKYSDDLNIDISELPIRSKRNVTNVKHIIEKNVEKKYTIDKDEEQILKIWDEFKQGITTTKIGFPIWLDELRETYDISVHKKWKQDIINRNRNLYIENKKFIDRWYKKYEEYLSTVIPTKRKFEWQAGDDIKSVFDGIIQFRPSGIRVKRPTEMPALVAMVHIPIYGQEKRRLSVKEVARLQSFSEEFEPDEIQFQAYKQFGNSVNVEVVYYLLKQLLEN